jgi:hypothetical protein
MSVVDKRFLASFSESIIIALQKAEIQEMITI